MNAYQEGYKAGFVADQIRWQIPYNPYHNDPVLGIQWLKGYTWGTTMKRIS